jgi:AcrR family transcriptional regulator
MHHLAPEDMLVARRRGRSPGTADTRDAILTAAREAFAGKGYDRATIRAIAEGASVDPALVYHYFGSKENLFLSAMDLPVDVDGMAREILNAPRAEVGTRLVRLILDICDSPTGTPALALLLSTMTAHHTGGRTTIPIVRRVIAGLGVDQEQVPIRTGLVIAEIMGLVVTRYVLGFEPSASAAPDQLAAAIGPTVRHYLIDDLPGVFDPAVGFPG